MDWKLLGLFRGYYFSISQFPSLVKIRTIWCYSIVFSVDSSLFLNYIQCSVKNKRVMIYSANCLRIFFTVLSSLFKPFWTRVNICDFVINSSVYHSAWTCWLILLVVSSLKSWLMQWNYYFISLTKVILTLPLHMVFMHLNLIYFRLNMCFLPVFYSLEKVSSRFS